ncbi:hypothetical protein WJM97_17100 [Okeanomitos corallinicola TIOX110]|uniref:Uncharacterized protein n=1 Tax=Okeanomitos corallinicola TIOX110 TaxID=3133117 RepID=A0ABZ2UPM6_9CYAN
MVLSNYEFYLNLGNFADFMLVVSWKRMTLGEKIDSDEVLLKHEILESDLVINL